MLINLLEMAKKEHTGAHVKAGGVVEFCHISQKDLNSGVLEGTYDYIKGLTPVDVQAVHRTYIPEVPLGSCQQRLSREMVTHLLST